MKGYFVFLNNKFLTVKICENLKWWPRKPTYLDWCKRCYPILEYLFQVEHLKSYISLAHQCKGGLRLVFLFSRQTALFNQHCWRPTLNTQWPTECFSLFFQKLGNHNYNWSSVENIQRVFEEKLNNCGITERVTGILWFLWPLRNIGWYFGESLELYEMGEVDWNIRILLASHLPGTRLESLVEKLIGHLQGKVLWRKAYERHKKKLKKI